MLLYMMKIEQVWGRQSAIFWETPIFCYLSRPYHNTIFFLGGKRVCMGFLRDVLIKKRFWSGLISWSWPSNQKKSRIQKIQYICIKEIKRFHDVSPVFRAIDLLYRLYACYAIILVTFVTILFHFITHTLLH